MRKKEPTSTYLRTYLKWTFIGETALFLGAVYYYYKLNSSREYRLSMLRKKSRLLEAYYWFENKAGYNTREQDNEAWGFKELKVRSS